MVIYVFLIHVTWIINSSTARGTLVRLKHNVALHSDSFVQVYGLTVYECYEECFYRKRCKSFNFRRKFKVCVLNSDDSAGDLTLAEAHGYVYSEKLLWNMVRMFICYIDCTF